MPSVASTTVELRPLTMGLIEPLVTLAVDDADPEDVMPPVPGHGWSVERTETLRGFYLDRVDGLGGVTGEQTYAICQGGRLCGVARLAKVGSTTLDAGLWLGRSARGGGIGSTSMRRLCELASELGASQVVASTTVANAGALGALRACGASIDVTGTAVTARVRV